MLLNSKKKNRKILNSSLGKINIEHYLVFFCGHVANNNYNTSSKLITRKKNK